MNIEILLKQTEDEQKGYIYCSVINWIAKKEKNIKRLEVEMALCLGHNFIYKYSKYLLECEERSLKELKEFKAKLEDGDFDTVKELGIK
jgi:hypothetical protein